MERGTTKNKWILITVTFLLMLIPGLRAESPTSPDEVMDEFIYISGMRMGEYNFWLSTEHVEDCAVYCLEDDRIFCKSFSYSESAAGCGTYEKSRADAPPRMYVEPVNAVAEDGETPSWGYYERKSKEYKILEQKLLRLQNLTEISVAEATEVLSEFGDSLRKENETEGSGAEVPVSPGELDLMSQMMKIVVDLNPVADASVDISENFANVMINVSDSMMQPAHVQSWKALQRDPTMNGIAGIVTSSEVVTRDVSERLLSYANSTSVVAEASNIGLWMSIVEFPETEVEDRAASILARLNKSLPTFNFNGVRGSRSHEDMYVFPPRNSTGMQQQADDSVLSGDVIMLPTIALRNRSVVTHVRYKGLADVIPPRDINQRSPPNGTSYAVKSSVLTTSIHPKPSKDIFKEQPVKLIFTHYPKNDSEETTQPPEGYENTSIPSAEVTAPPNTIETTTHCVFWNEGDGTTAGGWSSEGCELEFSNDTHTICKCTHLTSFAVLLKMVDTSIEDPSYLIHNRALSIISYIGCALSLGGVVIMCGAFIMLKFHTENMKIHFNLGVAVGAADLVFIFEELAQRHQYSCVLVTVLLYYFNMAVLSWMLIEGLFLYSQVVVVFVSARRWVKYYVLSGWGIPAIIMGISMGILNVQLGKNEICWLSPADNSIWAFAAPAILVVVINFVILASVVRVIVGIQPDQTNNVRISKVKNAVKGSIFLSPLLGTTWLFGFLSLSHETLLFQYLFATTNSLQGFFLFVFHCLCNSEVRADLARRQNRKPSTSSGHGGKSPPWFSGTFGLNVASGLRKFRDSISFEFASSSHSSAEHSSDGNDSKETTKGSLRKLPAIEDSNEANDDSEMAVAGADQNQQRAETKKTRKSKIPQIKRSRTSKSLPAGKKPGKLRKREVTDLGHTNSTFDENTQEQDKVDQEKTTDADHDGSYEDETVAKTPVVRKPQFPPSLSMPLKNDMILTCRSNRVAPTPSPTQEKSQFKDVNEFSTERQTNLGQDMTNETVDYDPQPTMEEDDRLRNNEENDRDKEAYKIPMSYDSGLNSIDNESLLEEEYNDEFVEMPYGRYRVGVHGCDIAM